MKARIFFQGLIRAGVVAAVAFVWAYQPAIAIETRKDVSKEISDLRGTVKSAEVYLVGRDAIFRHSLSESDVIRMSCRKAYVASSPVDVDSLIDVLANAKLIEVPASKDGYDARIVVRLYQSDSQLHTLVSSNDYGNAPAQGEYRHDSASSPGQAIPVEAKNGIEKSLQSWAAQHEALVTNRCRR